MTSEHLRESFLKFFAARGHTIVRSSSLLPDNDATVLLTTAGMQQFKPYFLGDKDPMVDFKSRRTTTVQKSFRTSDIDEVGDTQHLTFFEMLGNFSFGDYGKAEAIAWAWEYLTKTAKLDQSRLWMTVFEGTEDIPKDEAAIKEWKKFVPKDRIIAMGKDTNFWGPAGDSGPCGPSSEIHWQVDPHVAGDPKTAPENFVELWNLVFTEFNQDKRGHLKPLPQKNIDTGLGLDRLAMVVQSKPHVFATDLFAPIMAVTEKLADFGDQDPAVNDRRARIVADHLRGAIFLLADGVTFSNKDQGYILRRIVRRAADQFLILEFSFDPVVDAVFRQYGTFYPELRKNADAIKQLLNAELGQYRKVLQLDVGAIVAKMRHLPPPRPADVPQPSHRPLAPDEAFILYTTHGISLDRLVRLGYEFNAGAVEALIAEHQEKSRAGATKKFGGHGLGGNFDESAHSPADIAVMTRLHTATHLLQAALRAVLGDEVKQAGSDINPERFRFDFSFPRKLTDEEKAKVESLVNEKIKADLPVTWKMEPYAQATKAGALAFFREKYPDEVKVYTIGDFSKELCGGPHVEHTAQVGKFTITAEQSVGSGLRRIKATVM